MSDAIANQARRTFEVLSCLMLISIGGFQPTQILSRASWDFEPLEVRAMSGERISPASARAHTLAALAVLWKCLSKCIPIDHVRHLARKLVPMTGIYQRRVRT